MGRLCCTVCMPAHLGTCMPAVPAVMIGSCLEQSRMQGVQPQHSARTLECEPIKGVHSQAPMRRLQTVISTIRTMGVIEIHNHYCAACRARAPAGGAAAASPQRSMCASQTCNTPPTKAALAARLTPTCTGTAQHCCDTAHDTGAPNLLRHTSPPPITPNTPVPSKTKLPAPGTPAPSCRTQLALLLRR